MRLLLAAAALLVGATPALAADVVVQIDGVKAKGGTVLVALYGSDPIFRNAVKTGSVKAEAGQVSVTLSDVPAGDYAVTVLHDADDDGKPGMADGRMSEGTAITNAEAMRGPPSFAVNKVAVPAKGATIKLAMSYPEDRSGW